MKQLILLLFLFTFFISCKKEKPYNPDEHIVYTKWFELKSLSTDTLFKVFIPNAFTPDGNGVNDEFYPRIDNGYGYTLLYSFEVYDRNNTTVFKAREWSGHWDGTYYGTLLPIGTYTYKIIIADSSKTYERAGTVLLIK